MQDSPATQCVLRVFNGPLQGCEFTLSQQRTFFIVGAESQFCSLEQPTTIPNEVIYVPLASGGCNFEVLLEDNGCSGCIVRLQNEEGAQELALAFQQLHLVGALQVALRPADEPWAIELLEPSAVDRAVGVPKRMLGTVRQCVLAGAMLALLMTLALVGWSVSRPSQVSSIEALIGGTNTTMTVLNGRDNQVYIVAESERDASWGRQVLVRNGYAATQVVTTYDEQKRLEALAVELAPQLAYHRMDLSDPATPKLLISQQRNVLPPDLKERLESALRVAAPYARDVEVVSSDDTRLSRLAEEGLRRLMLPFTRQVNADSVTFTVEGSLDDVELQALGSFITSFNRQWGERYVHFALELRDDWLKGKSFQYGPQGYIKMTPSSWYFPKPL
ncbi:PrgH/EprH family type III secretion apparatus protein [Pseudomonas chlororaphis subsp. aurantiaca]|uniref:PrgH/EprH family type III secretion apparatus protein n=1 Tax=Pseudomonas chlororaphis TaxID=587753 RepID=UPI0027DC3242|nr:PrgH/EprH family type III secretion apparatus protein [Pseudomonas chlororaphis]WMI97545.1 PrgH/EprH family type III secretion apparatus protein [Pseudomonas chlororaphis subsp. aurantiaca]